MEDSQNTTFFDDFVVVDASMTEEYDIHDIVLINDKDLKGFSLYSFVEKIRSKILRPIFRINIDLSFKELSKLEPYEERVYI